MPQRPDILFLRPRIHYFEVSGIKNHGIIHNRLFLDISADIVDSSGLEREGLPHTTRNEWSDWINYSTHIKGGFVEAIAIPALYLATYTVKSTRQFNPELFYEQLQQHLIAEQVTVSAAKFSPYKDRKDRKILSFPDRLTEVNAD